MGESEITDTTIPVCIEDVKLSRIDPNLSSYVTLMKWIEFLMERAGTENLHKILEWYADIGWINDEVYMTMLTYAKGIDYDGGPLLSQNQDDDDNTIVGLSPNDHIRSLLFIEKINGKKLERTLLTSLEDEIVRVKDQFKDTRGI
jgi:flagellar protein FlaD